MVNRPPTPGSVHRLNGSLYVHQPARIRRANMYDFREPVASGSLILNSRSICRWARRERARGQRRGASMSGEELIDWISERTAIHTKKEAGHPPPWTDDPVLREWSFCNVRREDDRVTRWI